MSLGGIKLFSLHPFLLHFRIPHHMTLDLLLPPPETLLTYLLHKFKSFTSRLHMSTGLSLSLLDTAHMIYFLRKLFLNNQPTSPQITIILSSLCSWYFISIWNFNYLVIFSLNIVNLSHKMEALWGEGLSLLFQYCTSPLGPWRSTGTYNTWKCISVQATLVTRTKIVIYTFEK